MTGERNDNWERVYATKDEAEVSWYQDTPAISLEMIERAGVNRDAAIVDTLEDTPFYARSTLAATLCGERTLGVHESLDLDRFNHPVVQWMLPFRMPRARR